MWRARSQLRFIFVVLDAPRLFPFLRARGVRLGARWVLGQFRIGVPFAVANATELALLNLPVLLVSALVSDRVAVAQWGLTRVVAGLLRALCIQATLPLAAELGHDYAVGLKDQLRRLYSRGSVFVTLLASIVVSGLLPFWQDFFALWTHGAVPYDSTLAITLLIGTGAVAPSILALGYANYSNRGDLLVRTKGLQLAVFLALSVLLIHPLGPLGAAIAVVASDLLVQFGLLGVIMIRQTLARPFRHVAFLAAVMILVTSGGWALGTFIRSWMPGTGLGALCRRVRAVAGRRCPGGEPVGERSIAQQTDRRDSAMKIFCRLGASDARLIRLDPGKIRRLSSAQDPVGNRRDTELVRLFQNARYYPSLRPKIRELTKR